MERVQFFWQKYLQDNRETSPSRYPTSNLSN
jgi:hypothetical protein